MVLAAATLPAHGKEPVLSNEDVRQRIISESIGSYSGSCPCPYNTARNGSRCGGRSAYSRPGGTTPSLLSQGRDGRNAGPLPEDPQPPDAEVRP